MPTTQILPHVIPPERLLWMRKRIFRETRGKFFRRLWVSESTVKSWELGHRTPNGPALKWLCLYEMEAQSIQNEREALLERSLEARTNA